MSWVDDLKAQAAAKAEAASYGGNISKPVATPDDYQLQIDQLQKQLAALPNSGGFYSSVRRVALQGQINTLQKKLAGTQQQFNPSNGITPPVAPAPTIGPRITAPRVGIDALKILLPTT